MRHLNPHDLTRMNQAEPDAHDAAHTPKPPAADIAQGFALEPLVAGTLRTRRCIPGSVLLVEHVDEIQLDPDSSSQPRRALRLLLGDGQLCVQALLQPAMHMLVDAGDLREGCLVRLAEFSVRQREVDVSGPGAAGRTNKMVYLVVDDVAVVGWHAAFAAGEPGRAKDQDQQAGDDREARGQSRGRDTPEDATSGIREPQTHAVRRAESLPGTEETRKQRSAGDDDRGRSYDEAAPFRCAAGDATGDTGAPDAANADNPLPRPRVSHPVALPRDWTSPSTPLKLTSLRSVPRLPYRQNWSVNVLAVVSALSDVEPSPFPPPSHVQRTARLADPSTEKQVHLTVFLDPEAFAPRVGSVVLLAGVKNHLFDGGSLRKYVSDRPRGRGFAARWWFQEPRELEWCDVGGMERWWEGRGGVGAQMSEGA